MGIIFFLLILLSVLLAAVSGIRALGAWLRFRRARIELQGRLTSEVNDLARKTTEIEASLTALDARTQQLPVKVSELQESLSTLTVLTGALSATLRQAQQVLSYSALKAFSSTRMASLLGSVRRPARDR